MFVVDTNVLIHAVNRSSAQHEPALTWLDDAINGSRTVGLAWVAMLAFVRLTTRPVVMPSPLSTRQAMDVIETWISAPACTVVQPTARHTAILRGLLSSSGAGGNLVTDAHLAALCLEHDATMVSFDRDFQRFDGLATLVPGG